MSVCERGGIVCSRDQGRMCVFKVVGESECAFVIVGGKVYISLFGWVNKGGLCVCWRVGHFFRYRS